MNVSDTITPCADAALLARIHAAAFGDGDAWNAGSIALLLGFPGTFAITGAGQAMAMARVAADESELLTLAVVPRARRLGLGRSLLGAASVIAASAGARAMFLEVSEANLPARALYAAAGYRPVGRRRRYYAGGADALVLRADLRPGEATTA